MEFIILIVGILIGTIIGWRLREYYAMRKVAELLEQAEQLAEEEDQEPDRVKIRLERHGDMLYAFEEETHTFIAQGKDLEDLDTAIVARFPGKKFSIKEQNLIDVRAT